MILCILAAGAAFLGFWAGMSLLLGSGALYAANAGERMAQEAAARMEQEGITKELVPDLCGYVIWEKGSLVDTDLNGKALRAARNYRKTEKTQPAGFIFRSKMGRKRRCCSIPSICSLPIRHGENGYQALKGFI